MLEPSAVALASTSPSWVASPEPTTNPSVEPSAEPTVEPTAEPEPIEKEPPDGCQAGAIASVREFLDAPAIDHVNGVRICAWLDYPSPLGFECPCIAPAWLAYPDDSGAAMWHVPPPNPDHLCRQDEDCWWFFPHLDPQLELAFEPLKRWVIVTGHTYDPRAERCHYEPYEGVEHPGDDADAVRMCREKLVVTDIEDAS